MEQQRIREEHDIDAETFSEVQGIQQRASQTVERPKVNADIPFDAAQIALNSRPRR